MNTVTKITANHLAQRNVSAFKAYDVRGVVGETIDADLVHRIARAAAYILGARQAVVGFDARESSPEFAGAAIQGISDAGGDTLDLGLCGTEEVYFATGARKADLGIMVTASHNPISHNGLKLVGPAARPLSESEFAAIKELTASGDFAPSTLIGTYQEGSLKARKAYMQHIQSLISIDQIGKVKIVFNCGNGAAGPTLRYLLDALAARGSQISSVLVQADPDPSFPNGIPNPLLPENHGATADAVREYGADFGVAFDGDFDRCFLFDGEGKFVEGEYVVALIAAAVLKNSPRATIVHDPRVVGAIDATVAKNGGQAVASKTGHAFVKATMRRAGAAYGGEMSAHHYFRDFFYCDSGMLPWLKVAELLGATGQSLSQAVAELRTDFPSSGEINFKVANKAAALDRVRSALQDKASKVDELDGLSLTFDTWRFNLRASNTENLLRLNIEGKDAEDVQLKVAKISNLINA